MADFSKLIKRRIRDKDGNERVIYVTVSSGKFTEIQRNGEGLSKVSRDQTREKTEELIDENMSEVQDQVKQRSNIQLYEEINEVNHPAKKSGLSGKKKE